VAEFRTVAKAVDVGDGEVHAFDVGDRAVAVAHVADDWYAFDDVCTHRGCSLSDGELEGTSIVCMCHGSEFDMESGDVLQGPAVEALDVFEIRVEGDDVEVAV